MLRRWGSRHGYLVLSGELVWEFDHREVIQVLTLRALALRQNELIIPSVRSDEVLTSKLQQSIESPHDGQITFSTL